MRGIIYSAIYVATVVAVNILFSFVDPIPTSIGMFSPVAVVVGLTFVFRDFAQREVGHAIFLPMVVATALSFVLAHPAVALASAVAFAASELVDWFVYTYTRRPFHQRIFVSSLLSTPIDTVVFLYWIGRLSWGTLFLMFLAKMFAAALVWYWHDKRQEALDGYDPHTVA